MSVILSPPQCLNNQHNAEPNLCPPGNPEVSVGDPAENRYFPDISIL